MAERKPYTVSASQKTKKESSVLKATPRLPLFEKENYMWMVIGVVVVALGMLLMSGGKNQDPNQFDYKVVYSTTRITVAPILILAGLMIEVYAIFKKPKVRHANQ